jgi:hypothetical protein
LGLGLVLSLLGAASVAAASQEEVVFSHAKHVRAGWVGAEFRAGGGKNVDVEYDRDCRGCHDYGSPANDRVPPAQLCNRCHFFQAATYKGAALVDPRGEHLDDETGRGRFNHKEHQASGCFVCHGVKSGPVPDRMPISTSSAQTCMDCHDIGKVAGGVREGLEDALDERLASRKFDSQRDPFRHDQHIRPDEYARRDTKKCQECHAGLLTAETSSLGEAQFSVERCEECHDGAEFQTEPFRKDSRTAGTFIHNQHLGLPDLAKDACYACHKVAGQSFDLADGFFSAGKADAYKTCAQCHHDVPRETHGSVDDCRDCHDLDGSAFGKDAAVWKQRSKSEVWRPAPATFQFGIQAHEFVTGAKRDEDCAQCHRATLVGSASKLDGKRFQHTTHLTKASDDDAKECLSCHANMTEARTPGDIRFDPRTKEGRPLYDLGRCEDCHHAKELAAALPASAPREVLRFSHAVHLGKKQQCVQCHEVRGERVELRPEAGACQACHDHLRPETTRNHKLAEVQACIRCHRIGIPERGEKAQVDRLHLAGVSGQRSHPSEPDQACGTCHFGTKAPTHGPVTDLPIKIAMRRTADMPTPHQNLQKPENAKSPWHKDWFFEGHKIAGRTLGTGNTICIDCHWGSYETIRDENAPRIEKQLGESREHRWRLKFGALLDAGFPGFDASAP